MFRLRVLVEIAIIVLVVFLAYLPSINGGFVLDDNLLLAKNDLIRASDGLCKLWCTNQAPEYYPVAYSTNWVEWRLWRMHPAGYHVTNLILHAAEALLIWIVLRKLSIPGSFWAALIFAVHPVNVESAAWIAQRRNMVAMLFLLLSILWYLKVGIPKGSNDAASLRSHGGQWERDNAYCPPPTAYFFQWYWLSLAAFMLAMLGKGSAAVLPALLLGMICWQRKLTKQDSLRIAPFFIIAAVLTAVNIRFQEYDTGGIIRDASFLERLLGAGGVIWFYLYKALLPLNLIFVYPQWNIQTGNILWWLPLLSAVAVTAVLWLYRETWSRPFLYSWGFFCVSLVPVMGFTDVGFMRYSLVADHYQHIAIIGVIALAAAGWSTWRGQVRNRAYWVATGAAVAAMSTLAFLTWRQSGRYHDAVSLYQTTLQKNPGCWLAHNNLGFALGKTGRLQEEIEHYEQALRLKPDYAEAHNNLGAALAQTGRHEEEIEHYMEALRLRPDYAEAHNNLGAALAQTGRHEEEIEHYRQALRLRPDYAEAYNNLGAALAQTGRIQEAIENCEQALRLDPDYADAYNALGLILAKAGRPQEAIKNYRQALRLKPDFPDAHYNLGNVFQTLRQYQQAMEHYEQALRLNPEFAEAHNALGAALVQAGRPGEAIEHCEQALRLKPDYPEAYYNLGNALIQTGRPEEAIENYKHALRGKPDYPEAINNLGLALVQMDRFQEAIGYFEQALRLRADYINACYNLALAYAGLHKSTEAIATAQKALELARSKGRKEMAKQIEDWLNAYRADLLNLPNESPSDNSKLPVH